MGAFLRNSFAHVDNVIRVVKTINHMAAPVKVARQQTPPELSGTFRTLPPEPTPTRAGTLRNPASGTFRTLPPEPTPTRAGTLRNPPEPSGTCLRNLPFYTGTLRNLTGTCLRNLHQQTPELSGTLRNLPPEPSSGTCSCNPHRHTPELIWAEDSISLRCWGIINFISNCAGWCKCFISEF